MKEILDNLEKERKYDEMIRLIDEEIIKDPENAHSLLFRKANAYIALEKMTPAINILNVYVKDCSNEDKIKAYILIATCYTYLNEHKKTDEYLEKALELDPDNELILKQLSYGAYINEDFKKCCEYVKRLIKLEKADIEDYINLIFCCIQLDKIDEALEYAEKIIEIDPTNLDVFATLTILYESLENEEKLKEVCKRIIDLKDDGTLQIILLKAQASLELGNKEVAFEYVDKAVKLNPYDPFPYMMKGMLYNKLDMPERAEECFNEAFRLNPELLDSMERLI